MRVSAAQIVCKPGDTAGNLEQVVRLSREAACGGSEFVLFAEGCLTGYVFTPENLARALAFDGPEAELLAGIARESRIGIAVGTLERVPTGVCVSEWVFLPDGRRLRQFKHNLTPTEVAAGIVRGPRERTVFEFRNLRFAVLICADNGIEKIDDDLKQSGVQVLCSPCAGGGDRAWMCTPEQLRDPAVFKSYAEHLARVCFVGNGLDRNIRNGFAVIAVNLVGDDGFHDFHPGHSSISDRDGRLAALLPGDYVPAWHRPQFITAEIWS